jgi:hypothetical protein
MAQLTEILANRLRSSADQKCAVRRIVDPGNHSRDWLLDALKETRFITVINYYKSHKLTGCVLPGN